MTALTNSIAELQNDFRSGMTSPIGILESVLSQIAEVDPLVNCMAEVDETGARQAAKRAVERLESGHQIGPLDGVPVTLKDSINAIGMAWRHGTAPNADRDCATADSPPAARLREAGAVIVGKTTMPDLGMLASGVSSLYGIIRNPWDLDSSPGGSSSGAAAALASGIGFGAVGTDIAGSVRLPAGHCGLVALKPTQGRIAHVPVSTMRSPGPIGRTVDDVAALFDVLAMPDRSDANCLPSRDALRTAQTQDVSGLRVGVLTDMGYGLATEEPVLDAVYRASATLKAGGASVELIAPPFEHNPYPALDRVFQVRAWAEVKSMPAHRRSGVESHVAAWASEAEEFSADEYFKDLTAVSVAAADLTEKLSKVDVVLSPILSVVRFPASAVGLDVQHPLAHCAFTCWYNQTGQPAVSLCFGMYEGMPIGVQLAAPRFADDLVLGVAHWLEERRPFEVEWPGRSDMRSREGR